MLPLHLPRSTVSDRQQKRACTAPPPPNHQHQKEKDPVLRRGKNFRQNVSSQTRQSDHIESFRIGNELSFSNSSSQSSSCVFYVRGDCLGNVRPGVSDRGGGECRRHITNLRRAPQTVWRKYHGTVHFLSAKLAKEYVSEEEN